MTIRGEFSDGPFVLDAANANRLVHQRSVSTTAPQALLMMNDPFVQSQAKALASRLAGTATVGDRIVKLYQLLFSRPPQQQEVDEALRFLELFDDRSLGWLRYCHVMMCSNELIYRK